MLILTFFQKVCENYKKAVSIPGKYGCKL